MKTFLIVVLCIGWAATLAMNKPFIQSNDSNRAYISGKLPIEAEGDTLILTLWEYYSRGGVFEKYVDRDTFTTVVEDGIFSFDLPVTQKVQYFFLHSSRLVKLRKGLTNEERWADPGDVQLKRVNNVLGLSQLLIEPGDEIFITMERGDVYFSGKGSEKLQCLSEIEKSVKTNSDAPRPKIESNVLTATFEAIDDKLTYHVALKEYKLNLLENYKPRLSQIAYDVLYTDISAFETYLRYYYGGLYLNLREELKSEEQKLRKLYHDELYGKDLPVQNGIPDEALGLSAVYSEMVMQAWRSEGIYEVQPTQLEEKLNYIQSNFTGLLRDKILLRFATDCVRGSAPQEVIENTLNTALTFMKLPAFRMIVEDLRSTYLQGQEVLDFAFTDQDDNIVRLSDFRGKMVYIDMWFTGCGACTIVAEGMRFVEEVLHDMDDLVFLSISIDKDKDTWLHSIKENAENSEGYYFAGKYFSGKSSVYLYTGGGGTDDPFIKKYVASGYPTLMLIDKEGTMYSARPPRPNRFPERYNEVINFLKEALAANK